MYHEATFLEKEKERAKATFHSTAVQAAKIASEAKVKRLLIGHLSARYDSNLEHEKEAAAIFPNVKVVKDLETIILR